MQYENIQIGTFIERPNRFISHIIIDGKEEVVHVKNTGRCKELLIPEASVYVDKAKNKDRKTNWDLIAVQKGERLINMDSQAPNQVVKEWLLEGGLFPHVIEVRPEVTYGKSRLDFLVTYKKGKEEKKAFIEVKGVTLEKEEAVLFPDAKSPRASRHLEELITAKHEGYDAYVIFIIQMENVRFFTPNQSKDPIFAKTLLKAHEAGVQVLAYDCLVKPDSLCVHREVPVSLHPSLFDIQKPLVAWYRENKRALPWRENQDPYHIWVSEIMLQQTRVEAVKGYYARFLETLPTIEALASVKEDELLKLWEGLGYYNRVRNMQEAAKQVTYAYKGEFPSQYEQIRELKGIGSYTAGAIASLAFFEAVPAVDGNVLRVMARLLADGADIKSASMKKKIEDLLIIVLPKKEISDFNQGLIELGALVCIPRNPKCTSCPLAFTCEALKQERVQELPFRSSAPERRIENRTVFILRKGEEIAISKRPLKGLLKGLYELPNVEGHLTRKEVATFLKERGVQALRIKKLQDAKHMFSHLEWNMIGYEIKVDEWETDADLEIMFVKTKKILEKYPIPSAFDAYMNLIGRMKKR